MKKSKKDTIGVLSNNYAAHRLFRNKLKDVKYKDVRLYNAFLWKNLFSLIIFKLHLFKSSQDEIISKLFYNYKSILPTGCQLFHFFNCINRDTSSPWVISVETAVPWITNIAHIVEDDNCDFSILKNNKYIEQYIHCLALDNCKGLLVLSKCSYDIQMELLSQFPQYYTIIKNKTIQLSPPQELIIKSIDEKGLTWREDEPFTFFYVGRDYFRKGGRESVEILSELHTKYNFRLILISNLAVDDKKFLRTPHDIEDAKKLISQNQDWIEYYEELPNAEVIEKLKSSHICLLPTWMDTYAYSVLESQACGTPLITTSLRALNDTNNPNVGWSIKVPVNRLNHPLLNTPEQRKSFGEILKKGLREKIEYVLAHREEVKIKSSNCLKQIKQKHSPIEYNEKLRKIYNGEITQLLNDTANE